MQKDGETEQGMDVFNKVDIYDNDDNIIVSSIQISFFEDRITLLGDFPVLLRHGSIVNATGFLDDGFIGFNAVVTLSVETQINLVDVKYGEKKDRRNFLKVKAPYGGILLTGYELNNGKKTLLTDQRIRMRDISVGGVGFYFSRSLIKKQKILLQLDSIQEGFTAEAVVLRKEKMKHDTYKYRYGCRFLNLDNIQQSILCKYVFKVQIESRRRTNGSLDDELEVDYDAEPESDAEIALEHEMEEMQQ